jgi:hypothetical protein
MRGSKDMKFAGTTFLLMSLFVMSSCRIQAPVFKGVENAKLERSGPAGIQMGADIVFYNPNPGRARISDMALDVLLDGKNVATLGKKQDIVLARHTDTRIPVGLSLNTQGTILENLSSLLQLFKEKEMNLTIQGDFKMKVFCFFKYHIPIRHEQKINLAQIKLH